MTSRISTLVAALFLLGACAGTPARPAHATLPQLQASLPTSADDRNRLAAVAEAGRALAAFVPPSGANHLPGRPVGATALAQPASTPGTPNLVDETSWWSVRGTPENVLKSLTTPPAAQSTGSWSSSYRGHQESVGVTFSFTASPPIHSTELQVGGATVAGRTVLRVDSVVTYLPPRPAGSTIARATILVVGATPSGLDSPLPQPLGPATIVDPDQIAAVTALLNNAPPPLPGAHSCPMDNGGALRLDFRTSSDTVARAVIHLSGCGGIDVTTSHGGRATLAGGSDDATSILRTLGLDWKLDG